MATHEVHIITVPRPLTQPITLRQKDLDAAEEQKVPPTDIFLMSESAPSEKSGVGWWQWKDADGHALSPFFVSGMTPANIVPLDADQDGDTDYLIQYEGGYSEISYSILAQLRSVEIRAMANPPITRDIDYWLKDHLPGAETYQTPAERWTHFVFEAGAFQMFAALSDYFENLPPGMEPQLLQLGVEGIIGRFQERVIQARVDEKEISQQNNTPPERERWVLKKGLLASIGWQKEKTAFDARRVRLMDLHKSTTDHIGQTNDRIAAIAEKARRTAEQIGKEDGGIGVALDGSTLPEGYVTVTNLVVGGPALKAGLKIGDHITHIENRSVTQLGDEEKFLVSMDSFSCLHRSWNVQHAIAGAFGTTVDITVQRKGHPRTFHIPRNFQLSSLRFAGQIP